MPCPPGHFETWTEEPSSLVSVSCANSTPHSPQVMVPTLIPHLSHVYAAILLSFQVAT